MGVTVPNSKKPKPKSNKPEIASAFLSKPAARPTGFSKYLPKTSVCKFENFDCFLKTLSFNENRKKYKDYNESYDKSQDYYLRERNRFAWIAIGLYFYGILDSVVEAHLDDFDKIVKENDPQSETGDIDGK